MLSKRLKQRGSTTPPLALLIFLCAIWLLPLTSYAKKSYILQERMGYLWKNQFFTFAWDARPKECQPGKVRLAINGKWVPSQISELRYWSPRKQWIRSAKISTIVQLNPLQKLKLEVKCANRPLAQPRPLHALRIQRKRGSVLLQTPALSARLFEGTATLPANAKTQLPGPLLKLQIKEPRGLVSLGGSQYFGPMRFRSVEAKLVEQGPIFALWRYTARGVGGTMVLEARLVAGATRMEWHSQVALSGKSKHRKARSGWALVFAKQLLPQLRLIVFPEYGRATLTRGKLHQTPPFGKHARVRLAKQPKGRIATLVPWLDWFDDSTQIWWRFMVGKHSNTATGFEMIRRLPGLWRKPEAPGTLNTKPPWHSTYRWPLPTLWRSPKGEISIRLYHATGQKAWSWGTTGQGIGHRLQEHSRQVLSWPASSGRQHPRLYIQPKDWAQRAKSSASINPPALSIRWRQKWQSSWNKIRSKRLTTEARLQYLMRFGQSGHYTATPALRSYIKYPSTRKVDIHHLQAMLELYLDNVLRFDNRFFHKQSTFDYMRMSPVLFKLFDFIIDEPWLTPSTRARLRAKMAAFAYILASPRLWSSERGYGSGNHDMHYMNNMNTGLIGLLLKGHPHAKRWQKVGTTWVQSYLHGLGPNGESVENTHYMIVSLSIVAEFLVAAHNQGQSHTLYNPKIQKNLLYMLRLYTPRDPRFSNQSALISWKRGSNGSRPALLGIFAKVYQSVNPALSNQLYATWEKAGSTRKNTALPFAGVESLMLPLPRQSRPFVLSSHTDLVTSVMRSGFGKPQEHALFVHHRMQPGKKKGMITEHIPGYFAFGRPISTAFTAQFVKVQREYPLLSCVMGSRKWGPHPQNGKKRPVSREELTLLQHRFRSLPQQDHLRVCARFTRLLRQFPASIYPKPYPQLPRQSKRTTRPYSWCRQILFVKSPAAQDTHYLVFRDEVTGNQPTHWLMWTLTRGLSASKGKRVQLGNQIRSLAARKLPQTSRYRGTGQFGVDVEYFVASPAKTPRHTMRYGDRLPKWYNSIPEGLDDVQDALMLQLPGDGAYHVVLFPKKNNVPTPAFRAYAGGMIVEIKGNFGVDWTFLSASSKHASAGRAVFSGTAGAIQHRKTYVSLVLNEPGTVQYGAYQLQGAAASATWQGRQVTIAMPASKRSSTLLLSSPFALRLQTRHRGLQWRQIKGTTYRLTIPPQLHTIQLVRR